MATDDDDWVLPPKKVDIDRYQGQGIDLSDPINQGQRVADLRILADLSPQALAVNVGLTLSELLAIEAGLLTLHRPVALRLSTALGVRYAELWVDSDSQ